MSNKVKFWFFSIFGFAFFLMPFSFLGNESIAISHIVYIVTNYMFEPFIFFTQAVAVTVIIGTVLFLFYTSDNDYLNNVFKTTPLNIFLRIIGSFMYIMVINNWFSNTQIGSMITDPNTGGVMAGSGGLLTVIYITFFVGLLALPFLTHFGAVEFLGIILGPVVQKLFKVPGYSAVDAIASFVGDGTIGIVVTDKQYQRGYYNRREAYIIATSFSIVGISFAAAVAEELGFGDIFPIFYGAIALSTAIIAFVTARLPLKKYKKTYYEGVEPKSTEIPEDKTVLQHAYNSAIEAAKEANFVDIMKDAFKGVVRIYVGFLPVIMFVGTVGLIVAEYTPFFDIISAPLVPVFTLLGYSKEVASMMAPASLVGFADMYLPALFISGSPSEASRFFIGVLAFTQLIFMSETGMVLVETKIGVNFWDVIKVFVYRTVLSIPILFVITRILAMLGVISL
ncbi:MAG: YjiH family protein [Bacillota bacterium]